MPRLRLVLDVDTGVDDAQAIMQVLGQPDLAELTAITCTAGNTCLENVCRNTLRVLREWGRLDVPVYRGCSSPLLGKPLWEDHHGKDGFGNMPDPCPISLDLLEEEHACNALVRLAKENPGELTLVALGPPTNIAMAMRLYPKLGQDIKQVYIMGGNIEGKGNITPCAEFNFGFDPEAAHVLLSELTCPMTLLPWEPCLKFGHKWVFQDEISSYTSKKAQFYSAMTAFTDQEWKALKYPQNLMCDGLLLAAILDPSVALETTSAYCTVDTGSGFTRGLMVVDWDGLLGKSPNVTIIHKVDMTKIEHVYRKIRQ